MNICHKRKSSRSFDHFVGAGEQRRRIAQAERAQLNTCLAPNCPASEAPEL
jgi:hypothetical protein